MLIMGMVCIGATWWQLYSQNQRLELQVASMRRMAPKLRISRPQQFAAVRQVRQWYNEAKWDVYLPPGKEYQVCLALEGLTHDTSEMPGQIDGVHELEAGQYVFEVAYNDQTPEFTVQVNVDGETVIDLEKDANWNPRSSSSGGALFDAPAQQTTKKPFTIYQRRFYPSIRPYDKSKAGQGGSRFGLKRVNHFSSVLRLCRLN